MRITVVMGFFLPVPPAAGGATEKTWHRLALEFAGRGHEVTIVSRQWTDFQLDEIRDGVRHVRLPGYDHTPRLSVNLLRDARWSLRVWRRLPSADVTIVNAVTLPVVLGWARRDGGRLAVMIGRMPKGQFRLYRRLDRVFAVSIPVLEAVRAENPAAARRAVVTGYPIDWSQLAAARPARPGAITLGFIGRIHREKGLDVLAEAVARLARRPGLPPWRLVLCGPTDTARGGSGPLYADQLREQLGRASIPAGFELLAPIFDPAKLAALYRQIDVFCYPSVATQGETFGVAVAEAMAACAVPVVSALPCFTDYLRPGENGETFDHTSADAAVRLANTLERLLRDPARCERLARAAQESVRRYDFPLYAERLLADLSTLK